jgi:DNA-binding transcriptional LysR family regulator
MFERIRPDQARSKDEAMTRRVPPLQTEQIAAFVELARVGSLHLAAQSLHLSDEGLRGRILALEAALGVDLYEKSRGRRGGVELTSSGKLFLQRAGRFLDQAHELTRLFEKRPDVKEIQLIGSHYLMAYVLTDVARTFRAEYRDYVMRLSTRAEAQVLGLLLGDSQCAIGVCTPTDFPRGLQYYPWRSVGWSLALHRDHRWVGRDEVSLAEIAAEPLIAFERSSAGRLHVLEAFFALDLHPVIEMEATSTPLILSMIDAGLGISIIPTPSTTAPLRGLNVVTMPISDPVRPIETGLYVRSEWMADPAVTALIEMIRRPLPSAGG